MRFSDYLDAEWRPALGCTEPACIAWAAALAAAQAEGEVRRVALVCDPRMYKNCYAVGIPNSGARTGIVWAVALGVFAGEAEAGLEIFAHNNPDSIAAAVALIDSHQVVVEVDQGRAGLWVECRVERSGGCGRAVIAGDHSRLVLLQRDDETVFARDETDSVQKSDLRQQLAQTPFAELLELAAELDPDDRDRLRQGVGHNLAIAEHGISLFPKRFAKRGEEEVLTRIAHLVCGGVYARMSGEDFVVMTLAGSGNKGITCAVPIARWGDYLGAPAERVDEALALACLVTSASTWYLGALSAVCGCSNAAGIGLAAGKVLLECGDEQAMSLAVNNMVGNVAGMICDGAKIGCGLKTMTAVDAAYRAAALALSGVGIPVSDGIVGAHGQESLAHLGRIANRGMVATDSEILAIMREKMGRVGG